MKAVIVICTHNRARLLGPTLDALVGELSGNGGVEVLVVDNNSTDDTTAVVGAFREAHPGLPLRYVFEPVTGLSQARNTGIRETTGDVVIFLDDDATVRPGWLEAMLSVFADSDAAAVGGRVEPSFELTPPRWLVSGLLVALARVDLGPMPRRVALESEGIAGANIAFRRSALDRSGGFSAQLGRKGALQLSGEEMELCHRVARDGGSIWYTPHAVIDHHIPAARLTKRYFRTRIFQQGVSEQGMRALAGEKGLVPGTLRRFAMALLRYLLTWPVETRRFTQELEMRAMAGRLGQFLRRGRGGP